MLNVVSHILTTVIGLVAKGPNAKSIAGGIAGGILMGGKPLYDEFWTGVIMGAGTSAREAGAAIGVTVVGGLFTWLITWLSPANK